MKSTKNRSMVAQLTKSTADRAMTTTSTRSMSGQPTAGRSMAIHSMRYTAIVYSAAGSEIFLVSCQLATRARGILWQHCIQKIPRDVGRYVVVNGVYRHSMTDQVPFALPRVSGLVHMDEFYLIRYTRYGLFQLQFGNYLINCIPR